MLAGAVCCWSAGCEGLQRADRGGELGRPGPGPGDAQPQPPAAADEAVGGGEQPQPLGSQARAGRFRASICIQAVSSQAIATCSHQTWFRAKPCRGRLRSPVSLPARMRSSHQARRRWRSSRSANWPRRASVAKQVKRCPADVGEAELCAGVGAYLADAHPHALRPVTSGTRRLAARQLPAIAHQPIESPCQGTARKRHGEVGKETPRSSASSARSAVRWLASACIPRCDKWP
jgi:hypothetical protein